MSEWHSNLDKWPPIVRWAIGDYVQILTGHGLITGRIIDSADSLDRYTVETEHGLFYPYGTQMVRVDVLDHFARSV